MEFKYRWETVTLEDAQKSTRARNLSRSRCRTCPIAQIYRRNGVMVIAGVLGLDILRNSRAKVPVVTVPWRRSKAIQDVMRNADALGDFSVVGSRVYLPFPVVQDA